MDVEANEEEEEHPAPADSVVVALTAADQAPSLEETKPFETDESAATPPPHPAYRTTARISIPAPVPMPAWTNSEVVRLLAISSPPASPLSPWSSPPPQIPFPPLPPILSPPSPILSSSPPPSPIRSLGYRLVRVPFGDKILIFHGDGSKNGRESRLNIISCTKTQRYLLKGCHIFLAHVTTKENEDKSKERRLEDVPIVQDFPKVFPEDLSGIPPSGVSNRFSTWCRTYGTGTLSISPI
nr:putative reverse transcriptase domain-containing protein [Tanacetum cinerariifolium]